MVSNKENEIKSESLGKTRIVVGILLIISFIASFGIVNTFGFSWYSHVMQIEDIFLRVVDIIVVPLTMIALFYYNVSYVRGAGNFLKKWGIILGVIGLVVAGILTAANQASDIILPLVGITVGGIMFYMLDFMGATIRNAVIVLTIFAFVGIGAAMKFAGMQVDTALLLLQISLLILLFIGASWPRLRKALFGVSAVNQDGSSSEGSTDVNGSEGE